MIKTETTTKDAIIAAPHIVYDHSPLVLATTSVAATSSGGIAIGLRPEDGVTTATTTYKTSSTP